MSLRYDAAILKAFESVRGQEIEASSLRLCDLLNGSPECLEILQRLIARHPSCSDVNESVYETKASDGHAIKIYGFTKKDSSRTSTIPGPAIFHIHGGGLISGSVPEYAWGIRANVSASGVPMYSVEYRLAAQSTFPVPVEDCYAGLLWLYENAKSLNIDPERIAIMGESAGGGLGVCVALMARDRKLSPPLAKQILIYPMLDDRNIVSNPELESFVTWSVQHNTYGWQSYLAGKAGQDGISQYAAAARAESLEGLPATYIDVGGLDLFRDEVITFATRLIAAKVETEFHLYPGVPHGFELFGNEVGVVDRAQLNRRLAMKSF